MKRFYPGSVQRFNTFKKPIQTIDTPITHTNNRLICIDEKWTPILRGALQNLLDPVFWDGSDLEIQYSIQQINELIGQTLMPSCDCILSCLQDSPEIREYIDRIKDGDPDRTIPAQTLEDGFLESPNCDIDALWGACQYLVDGIIEATFEILQQVRLATSPFEALGKITDSIPIISFVGDLGELINWISDYAYDAFLAVDSPANRDELSCELLCYALSSCNVNFDMVETVFRNNAKLPIPIFINITDVVEYLVGVVFSGDPAKTILSTMAMLGIEVMKHGGKFAGMVLGVYTLEQLFRLGSTENANNTWNALCLDLTTCGNESLDVLITFDDPNENYTLESFTYNEITFLPPLVESLGNPNNCAVNRATVRNFANSDWVNGCVVRVDFDNASKITNIQFNHYHTFNDSGIFTRLAAYKIDGTHIGTYTLIDSTLGKNTWHNLNKSISIDSVGYIYVFAAAANIFQNNVSGEMRIDNIRIT